MIIENNLRTVFYVVMDNWRVREFENEEEALGELKGCEQALFSYRTFCEKVEIGWNSTGTIEYFQDENIGWNNTLSFNNWRTVGLDTRGYPFSIKDPRNELKGVDSNGEEQNIYGVEWPNNSSYVGWIAKVLMMLSKFEEWEVFEKEFST